MHSGFFTGLCVTALIVILAGCESMNLAGRDSGPAPLPETKSEVHDASGNGQPPQQIRPAPKPPPTPKPRPGTADATQPDTNLVLQLVGSTENQVRRRFGPPVAVRNDPPAMVWEYVSSVCVVEIFFYFDIDNKDFRVLTLKYKPAQPEPANAETAKTASGGPDPLQPGMTDDVSCLKSLERAGGEPAS